MSTDPIDDLLAVGEGFNWIGRGWALVQDLVNGPAIELRVSDVNSFREIAKVLNRAGIKPWGPRLDGDDLCFSVRRGHAEFARNILARHTLDSTQAPSRKGKWIERG